jgi:sugar/nucleoside kinase (ribokinase family)
MYDVLGLGAVAVDDLLYVDEFPRPDGKIPVQAQERAGGGLAATALVAAARLGARAAFCAVLGDDELSRFTLDELAREGVDTAPVVRRPGARPIHAVIIVCRSSPDRSILYSYAGVQPPLPADVPEGLVASARVLLVDHSVAGVAIHAARLARRHGLPVVGDVEITGFPEQDEFLASIDHLIVNVEWARAISGAASPEACASALLQRGHAAVVVTNGAAGCVYARPGQPPVAVPVLPVPAVDTTGCGDVFHGAYAACLAWGGDVPEAVRWATVAAGLKTRQMGGRAGIPTRAEVEAHLGRLR